MAPTFTSPTPVHSHRFICLDLDGGAYKISVLGQGIIVCEGVHIHQVLSRCLQHFGGEKNLGAAKLAILLGGSGLPCHGTEIFGFSLLKMRKEMSVLGIGLLISATVFSTATRIT
jgi:hypothetical protein